MNFEVLKRSHIKRNIVIAVIIILILSAVILTFTKAKYRVTQSMPLIQGTINFSPYDFNIIAMYLNKNGESISTEKAPHVGYTLNKEQSICEVNDVKDDNVEIKFEEGNLYFNKMNYKGTKCSIYFDLIPDSEKPVITAIRSSSSDDTSITITIDTTDNVGVYYYYYILDNGEEIRSEENTYTFEGLEKDSVHTITVRVEDAVGNISEIQNKEVKVGLKAFDIIEDIYEENQGMLAYDGTADNNLRYIGANPNNYVYFNCADYNNPSSSTCELWRIIGIFNENSHGISGEKLVKLIRNDSIGILNWDNAGTNNWRAASLQKTLNGDYLDGSGSYASNGIKNDTTRNMIANVTWKLGGTANYESASNGLASHWYGYERGTTVYSGRPTTWQGKVALMYPSDYGYATSGGATTNREKCLEKELYGWSSSSYSYCKNNDWILNSSNQWTLTPASNYSSHVIVVFGNGLVSIGITGSYPVARPSLYLSSNVSITSGDGTQSSPYTLSN